VRPAPEVSPSCAPDQSCGGEPTPEPSRSPARSRTRNPPSPGGGDRPSRRRTPISAGNRRYRYGTQTATLITVTIRPYRWELHSFSADTHPIHLRLVQFEILGRGVDGTEPPAPNERGTKDTVLTLPAHRIG
jgi:FtsP/CotA-like multicopper oxidase with cupredoxin domain